MIKINSVFISVFSKDGLEPVVRILHELGVPISSTGGTADFIKGLGIPVTYAETFTGYPSILGGRVKTLHPVLMGGILFRRDNNGDIDEVKKYKIHEIDLVIVDLYPFEQTVASGASHDEIVEKIDIGGITLIRAAAKNYHDVAIVSCKEQYPILLEILQTQGAEMTNEQHYDFAAKAFLVAAVYDLAIAMYFGRGNCYGVIGEKVRDLRYGENPWQEGLGLFKILGQDDPYGMDKIQWLVGDPGYINTTDPDRMLQTLTHVIAGYHKNYLWQSMGLHKEQFPFVAIGVKHGNPCGAAINSDDPAEALRRMLDGNLISIFGGSIITNFTITKELAEIILHYHCDSKRRLIDIIIAPKIENDALEMLKRKKDACKIGTLSVLANMGPDCLDTSILIRKVRGCFMPQQNYDFILDIKDINKFGSIRTISMSDRIDLVLGSAICATSNSNTLVLVENHMLIGAGVGQKDRVECCRLAVEIAQKAGHITANALAISDSFFPFDDGPITLINAGIRTIFSLSGSQNDQATIDLCDKHDIALWMIPNVQGRMFYAH